MTDGWVVAGAIQPGHDPLREDVGVLAGMEARHAWLAMAAICLTGLLVAAVALRVALDGARWPAALAPLLAVAGLAVAAAGGLRWAFAATAVLVVLFVVYRGGVLEWGGAVERALITVPIVWVALLAGHGPATPAAAPAALGAAARSVAPRPPRREGP